jgi:hypothetical protein
MKRFLPLLPLLLLATTSIAQEVTPEDGAEAAGAIVGGVCGCVAGLIGLAIWVVLVVFVYRDSKARGMDNAVLLTIVTAITGILGLIIYLLMRPKGNLVPCPSCQKKRLEGSAKCPHCGNP